MQKYDRNDEKKTTDYTYQPRPVARHETQDAQLATAAGRKSFTTVQANLSNRNSTGDSVPVYDYNISGFTFPVLQTVTDHGA